ncbi:Protein MAIN-LIKE 1 [Glycine soja]
MIYCLNFDINLYVCSNLQIMVRTRVFGRALGRVIGRALQREDNRDSNKVPQWRRPIVFARRQWEAAAIAQDVHHVDDTTKEVFQQPQEAAVDAQGFLGGSRDTSVLTAYVDHVVVIVWNGEGLISAFAERWHKETSSFHLPVGEVTITLDDVASFLHLPIIGTFHSFKTLHVDEAMLMLVELLEVSADEARAETVQCHGAYYDYHGYETFIITNSATHVHVVLLGSFRDLTQSGIYAWGVAALVHIVGFMNIFHLLVRLLLLKTIMKGNHVPAARPLRRHYQCRCIGSLESLSLFLVYLDKTDGVPLLIYTYQRGLSDSLDYAYKILTKNGCTSLSTLHLQCSPDYMDWFYMISHPFMRSAQPEDLVRHPPIVQDDTYVEPDMPQYPVAAIAMEVAHAHAPSHVEQPRHAMEACQAIAERLERLLNLRIVTKGTETYDVMQDCLRIARGVIVDRNVYVRSRRR